MDNIPFLLLFGLTGISLFFAGYLGKLLRFPLLMLYIFVGIILSQFMHFDKEIKFFGEIGIVVLFFFLGLEFNISRVLQTARKIWVGGLLDVSFNFLLILIVFILFGFDFITSFSFAGITYASSSAITTKIIIDEHRIANSETEFILGLMVFEDIVAPIILAFIAAFRMGNSPGIELTLLIFLKIILVVGGSILIAISFKKYIADFIEKYISDEILTLLVIGCVILASGFTKYLGLSEALGAFLIGIIVAESGKSFQIESLIIPIRDITVAYFFLIFGASIVFTEIFSSKMLVVFTIIILISIIGKILTGAIGGRIYGMGRFKSLISGLGIVNRGEFSIAMSQYLAAAMVPIATLYIFIMAIVGIITSVYSKQIAKKIYPKKPLKK